MSHLQSYGDPSAMLGQRADQPLSGANDPLPWLIRRLIREQGKQLEKKHPATAKQQVQSSEQ